MPARSGFILFIYLFWSGFSDSHLLGFPGGSDGEESASSAGDAGLIPGSGGSSVEGSGNPSSIPAQRIPWTEEPGRPQSIGSQRVRYDSVTNSFFQAADF